MSDGQKHSNQLHDGQSRKRVTEQLVEVNRILKAIILRRRKCKFILHFDGRRFRWEYTVTGITEKDVW
ncbi:hypothetical protein HQ587_08615 [bacterium]|nr:hypothetical protein [bacterium]